MSAFDPLRTLALPTECDVPAFAGWFAAELEQGGFVQRYRFSDATYFNRFRRAGTLHQDNPRSYLPN
jgi:hypothetical protein